MHKRTNTIGGLQGYNPSDIALASLGEDSPIHKIYMRK